MVLILALSVAIISVTYAWYYQNSIVTSTINAIMVKSPAGETLGISELIEHPEFEDSVHKQVDTFVFARPTLTEGEQKSFLAWQKRSPLGLINAPNGDFVYNYQYLFRLVNENFNAETNPYAYSFGLLQCTPTVTITTANGTPITEPDYCDYVNFAFTVKNNPKLEQTTETLLFYNVNSEKQYVIDCDDYNLSTAEGSQTLDIAVGMYAWFDASCPNELKDWNVSLELLIEFVKDEE